MRHVTYVHDLQCHVQKQRYRRSVLRHRNRLEAGMNHKATSQNRPMNHKQKTDLLVKLHRIVVRIARVGAILAVGRRVRLIEINADPTKDLQPQAI